MWRNFYEIYDWFGDMVERRKLVLNFNRSAKNAFIVGASPTLLKVSISRGYSNFRHPFSKWMAGGFRIKALSGVSLSQGEIKDIGSIILSNDELVRKLVSLGWDTLEVHDNVSSKGLHWELRKHGNIGGYLS